MSWARGGIAAKSPIVTFDAPSFSAYATRKTLPVNVTMAWLAKPSFITALRPDWTSASVTVSLPVNVMV